jgi:co-chaperonin GroES (HSP10)
MRWSANTPMLKQSDLAPFAITPHGDRLFVEVVEISNEIEVAGGFTIAVQRAVRDHEGKLTEEYLRGFCAGIVISVGDGHLLTSGSTIRPAHMTTTIPDSRDVRGLIAYDDESKEAVIGVVSQPYVPMPWQQGQVVLIERLARRSLQLGPRMFAMIDQMDVLATVAGLRFILVTNEEGELEWKNFAALLPTPPMFASEEIPE